MEFTQKPEAECLAVLVKKYVFYSEYEKQSEVILRSGMAYWFCVLQTSSHKNYLGKESMFFIPEVK